MFEVWQVAMMLNVAPRTVNKWIDAKRMKCHLTARKVRLVSREELETFSKWYEIPLLDIIHCGHEYENKEGHKIRVLLIMDEFGYTHYIDEDLSYTLMSSECLRKVYSPVI